LEAEGDSEMNKKRAICVTLMAISSSVAAAAVPAGAAPGPCKGGDALVSDVGRESYDLNGNDLICEHEGTTTYHAPKKPGPPGTSLSYYDDRI